MLQLILEQIIQDHIKQVQQPVQMSDDVSVEIDGVNLNDFIFVLLFQIQKIIKPTIRVNKAPPSTPATTAPVLIVVDAVVTKSFK